MAQRAFLVCPGVRRVTSIDYSACADGGVVWISLPFPTHAETILLSLAAAYAKYLVRYCCQTLWDTCTHVRFCGLLRRRDHYAMLFGA